MRYWLLDGLDASRLQLAPLRLSGSPSDTGVMSEV
jgi:hypothetical protein